MANYKQIAIIRKGPVAWNQWRQTSPCLKVDLTRVRLSGQKLARANFNDVDLSGAILTGADLSGSNLSKSDLRRANLSYVNLTGADLTGTDFRSANLQHAYLDRCWATDFRLWETQRAGWSVRGLLCERAYWDEDAKSIATYSPGQFEHLHSDRSHIEMVYPGGISAFELDTLPALIRHLASLHPGSMLRLKSIEEVEGAERGARIFISMEGTGEQQAEKIKTDAREFFNAQIALRDKTIDRLAIEKESLNHLYEKLISEVMNSRIPQNVTQNINFTGTVYGVVLSNDHGKATL